MEVRLFGELEAVQGDVAVPVRHRRADQGEVGDDGLFRMYSRPPNSRTSLAGEATATVPSAA